MANLFERTKISVMAKQQRDRRDERYAAAVTSEVATVVSPKAVAINGQIYRATVPGGVAGDAVAVTNQGGGAALYTPANASVVGSNGGGATGGTVGGAAMTQHDMTGSYHAATGLTAGQVLKATGTTTFGWRVLAVSELGPGTAQYQIPVTGATPFTLAYVALGSLNGDGLDFSGGQFVVDSSIARSAITVTGTGALGGGGNLTADRTITLNTPGTLTATSTNISSANHTHTIDSTIARSAITVTGTGSLGGGGALTANQQITLNTPGTLTASSANSSATNHTHTIDSTIARSAITVTGTGALGGGGNLTADRTISLNTPGTLTVATSNSSATNHTHAITSSSAPSGASILASDGTGKLTLPFFVATTSLTTPILTAAADLSITATGDITMDAGGDDIIVGASNTLRSNNYASQTTGWGIDYAGGADFRYVYADELHAKTFIADLEQALAGGQIISKSVAIIAVDFTVPAAGAAATLCVKDLPSAANMAVFQSGDIVRLRTFSRASGSLTIANCWGVVTSYVDQSDGTQTWTFTRSSGSDAGSISTGATISADSLALDYGTSGNGFYEVNAIDGAYAANSPYWQIVSWDTHPATGQTVNARGGKLTGIFSVANEYGVAAGTGFTASDSYVRFSSHTAETNNLISAWKSGGSTFLSIDATNGVQIESINSLTSSNQRAYSFTIAGAESGGLYHYYNSTYTEAVMMLNQSSASRNNNIFVQTESDSGKNSRIYLEAKETTQATAYIDLQADVGGSASEIQMGAYAISAYTSQILVKYANGSGGDGFASAPVYSFVDDTNTGIYRSAADQLNITTGGTSRVVVNTTSLSSSLPIYAPSGEGIRITGSTTGNTSTAYLAFYDSGGTRTGYVGDASTGNSSIYLVSNSGDVRIRDSSGVDVIVVSGGDVTVSNDIYAATQYASNRFVAGGADLSGNVSKFTGRYSTNSGISLTATLWGLGSAVLFNAYHANASVRLSASGACKYLGSQYTGNVTAPGMFYYDANANRFEWWIGEQGLASGADITSWAQQLQLENDGTLTLFGDLKWSSGGFAAAWTAATYNTNWSSYSASFADASYCRIGDLVLVNGLAKRTSGNSTTTVFTLPSGYRPATQKSYYTRMQVDGVEGAYRIDVATSGAVSITYTGTGTINALSLDCIQFRTNL